MEVSGEASAVASVRESASGMSCSLTPQRFSLVRPLLCTSLLVVNLDSSEAEPSPPPPPLLLLLCSAQAIHQHFQDTSGYNWSYSAEFEDWAYLRHWLLQLLMQTSPHLALIVQLPCICWQPWDSWHLGDELLSPPFISQARDFTCSWTSCSCFQKGMSCTTVGISLCLPLWQDSY